MLPIGNNFIDAAPIISHAFSLNRHFHELRLKLSIIVCGQ
jgi:hypothetical protein